MVTRTCCGCSDPNLCGDGVFGDNPAGYCAEPCATETCKQLAAFGPLQRLRVLVNPGPGRTAQDDQLQLFAALLIVNLLHVKGITSKEERGALGQAGRLRAAAEPSRHPRGVSTETTPTETQILVGLSLSAACALLARSTKTRVRFCSQPLDTNDFTLPPIAAAPDPAAPSPSRRAASRSYSGHK